MLRKVREEVAGFLFARRHHRFEKGTRAAFALMNQGRYDEAETAFATLLETAARQFGPDSSTAANALINMATLHQARGNDGAAAPMLSRALRISTPVPSPWATRPAASVPM